MTPKQLDLYAHAVETSMTKLVTATADLHAWIERGEVLLAEVSAIKEVLQEIEGHLNELRLEARRANMQEVYREDADN